MIIVLTDWGCTLVCDIPFDHIMETSDRSWSLRLVDELAIGTACDKEKIISALEQLSDRRTDRPLLAIVLDTQKPEAVRQAASDALFKSGSYDTAEERAKWWASHDPLVVRHALLMSGIAEAAFVTAIAAEPSHALYHDALRSMEFWEAPEFQRLIIKGLDHQDPRVRRTAAKCLLWEQPVAAEKRLLELARDENEDVAIAALDTLAYCASREIILELAHLRRSGPENLRDCYENVFAYVQHDFRFALPGSETEPREKAYILEWLKPVKHLLRKQPQKKKRITTKPKLKNAASEKVEVTARSIIADLGEINGLWWQKEHRYYNVPWTKFNDHDRQLLTIFFEKHADATVREIGARAYAAWQDSERILVNLYDRSFNVIKTSAYHARFLPVNQAIAKRLKELVGDSEVMNTLAEEVLESFVHHDISTSKYDWLTDLALNDQRPSIRKTAIDELNSPNSREHLRQLVSILDEPPINTWDLHCGILRGCKHSWVRQTTTDYLKTIDNLYLQQELASFIADS